ncbi:MAG: alpha/beta hydrolase [Pseudomonadota bacterium]|nr:alpha/beta hydrolase [Pseudomonadota bacterium]
MINTPITIGGFTFDVALCGVPSAPMVLMLHGFPQTNYTWRHQMRSLEEAGYLGVAPNQRGYSSGARPQSVAAYDTALLVDDALALMDHFGHTQAHIVGHDWGGQLSWLLAGHHAHRVRSLTVLSRPHPLAFLKALKEDPKQAMRSGHHQRFQLEDAADKLLDKDAALLRSVYQGVRGEDIEAYLSILNNREALDSAINWYRAPVQLGHEQPLAPGNMPRVDVPTLFMWGDNDVSVGRMAAESTGDFINAPYRLKVLEGVGHFVTDEAGRQVTADLLEFIQGVDAV